MLDVPMFTADLPGVVDGRRTLFDELARLAKPEVELTVSEFADQYRVVAAELGVAVSWAVEDGSRALFDASRWTACIRTIRRGGSR